MKRFPGFKPLLSNSTCAATAWKEANPDSTLEVPVLAKRSTVVSRTYVTCGMDCTSCMQLAHSLKTRLVSTLEPMQ
jgi:hypothetical protein